MFKNKKIPYIEFFPIIVLSIIAFNLLNHLDIVKGSLGIVISCFSAFIWAFGIAYLLNPLMLYLEKKFKLSRPIALLIVYIIVVGFIILLITIVTPTIIHSVKDLFNSLPNYIVKTQDTINHFLDNSKFFQNANIRETIENAFSNINSINSSISKFLNGILEKGVNTIFTTAIGFTSSFIKLIFGLIISIYMLKDKEVFIKNIKRLFYALLKKEHVDDFTIFAREVNMIFSKYIIGKFIDSLIIGILCFIGLTILRIPYSPLLSLIVGITNMIPYFGPFIGMVPATLLTLLSSPLKALWVLIFIILLQQFDGWYLGPKILGSHVGLSPFWIILGITVGGSAFGVLGMFLGAPVMAIIKMFVDRFISKKLKKKNLEI